ncbi:hypothetical protein B0T24DRAFT_624854 [Lasiosphaeria ovina]|uniref:Uncharacterized protein n=1 Tax=Lasiosphaeria ovina TaxID=92902 RepID=A0AAE0KCB3_9PEZI|nr:hypothetical protein B0T24DRAFT_624854 [Lasiosphaeria ovina]
MLSLLSIDLCVVAVFDSLGKTLLSMFDIAKSCKDQISVSESLKPKNSSKATSNTERQRERQEREGRKGGR